jgi:translation initiation factor 1 (eIF-1/SUI1)
LTKGQLRAAKKQAKNAVGAKPTEQPKPIVATKTGSAKKQVSESSESESSESESESDTEEEKPAKKKPAGTTIDTKSVMASKPANKKSSESESSESESSETEEEKPASEKSSSASSSESEEEETKPEPVKPAANIPKSNKVSISVRKSKTTKDIITCVVNIPDDIDLAKLARALGKVYKCKTRVRTMNTVPTIELKGDHKRDVREFITKVKIVELRQINMI